MGEYTAVIYVVFESWPILVVKGLEYVVHELLHHGRAVGGSEWHNCGCIEPISHLESQNILGPFFDCNVIVTFVQVEFAEEYCTDCIFEDGGDAG